MSFPSPNFFQGLCALFLLFAFVSPTSANSTAVTRRVVNACVLGHRNVANAMSVQHFVFSSASAAQFPNILVVPKLVAQRSSVSLAHGLGVALAQNAELCTVLVGPGSSPFVRASSILVDAPLWVGSVESWTEFSDNTLYPQFSRVGVSAAVGGLVVSRFLVAYRWGHVNLLTVDSIAGLNFQAAVLQSSSARSIRIGFQDSVPGRTWFNALDKLVNKYRASNTRVMVVSMGADLLDRFLTVLKRKDLLTYFYFVFAPDVCALDGELWKEFPGAFCVTLPINTTRLRAFESQYHARPNRPQFEALLRSAGVGAKFHPPQQHNLSVADAIAHDAAYFALASIDRYWAGRPDEPYRLQPTRVTFDARFTWSTNGTVAADGLTGTVTVDPKGDRHEQSVVIENIQFNTTTNETATVVVAEVTSAKTIRRLAAAYFAERDELLWAPPSHLSPEALAPPPPPPPTDYTTVFAIAATVAVIAVILGSVSIVRWYLRRRLLQQYPRDAARPFAVVFFSIKNEAAIRTTYGSGVAFSVCSRVAAIVQQAVAAEGCVVARKLDAHFMVVSHDVDSALCCAGRVARAASREDWSVLLQHPPQTAHKYAAAPHQMTSDTLSASQSTRRSNPKSKRHNKAMSSSLNSNTSGNKSDRVKDCSFSSASVADEIHSAEIGAGVAFGVGCITVAVNDPFDVRYGGTPVDQAAVLTDTAQADQILVSEVAEARAVVLVSERSLAVKDAELEEFINITYPGSTQVEAMYQYDPAGLPHRTYAAVVAKDSDDTASAPAIGSLSSAIEEATGGFATRPVAIAAIMIPDLQRRRVLLTDAQAVVQAVVAAAEAHQGLVISATGGEFIIAVNAAGRPVSQAVTRAAAIAMEATAVVAAAGFTSYVGVDCGAAAVGSAHSAAVVCTSVADRARALSLLTHSLRTTARDCSEVFVIASASTHSELHLSYAMRAVDICVWRNPNTTVVTAEGTHARGKSKPTLAYSVQPLDANGALQDDEWMYQLNEAEDNNAAATANAALASLAAGNAATGLQLLASSRSGSGGNEACAVQRVFREAGVAQNSSMGPDDVMSAVVEYGIARANNVTAHHSF